VNQIQGGAVQMMKKGEERVKENLKGIEIFAMILIVYNTWHGGKIAERHKILAH
jgi:cell division protein FtsB